LLDSWVFDIHLHTVPPTQKLLSFTRTTLKSTSVESRYVSELVRDWDLG